MIFNEDGTFTSFFPFTFLSMKKDYLHLSCNLRHHILSCKSKYFALILFCLYIHGQKRDPSHLFQENRKDNVSASVLKDSISSKCGIQYSIYFHFTLLSKMINDEYD